MAAIKRHPTMTNVTNVTNRELSKSPKKTLFMLCSTSYYPFKGYLWPYRCIYNMLFEIYGLDHKDKVTVTLTDFSTFPLHIFTKKHAYTIATNFYSDF